MNENKKPVGYLEYVDIRDLFRDEARHFTTWLEENIDRLAKRLGLELTLVQREKTVGDFFVDLLCEDDSGRPVIIENQLEKTDHDHLGKLVTYLVNLEAGTAIWITPEPRPEHSRVIEWLNENTTADLSFFLVRVEAARIDGSLAAPLFNIVAGPDMQSKEVGEKKKEWADRHFKRFEFWKGLLERGKEKTKLFANITPGKAGWISTGAGRAGVHFTYVIKKDSGSVELYIDHDKETGAKNKAIFDELAAQRKDIEKEFGDCLEWERLDERRACRIRKTFESGGLVDPETWPNLQERMIDAMVRLDRTLRSRIAKLKN